MTKYNAEAFHCERRAAEWYKNVIGHHPSCASRESPPTKCNMDCDHISSYIKQGLAAFLEEERQAARKDFADKATLLLKNFQKDLECEGEVEEASRIHICILKLEALLKE